MNWFKTHAVTLAAGLGLLSVGLGAIVVMQAIDLHRTLPGISWGNVSEAFGAAATFLAVAVALWQSNVVRLQAEKESAEAAARFTAELESQKELAKAELDSQKALARTQRIHLQEQNFKLALIRISRAADDYTHELATLIEQGTRAAKIPDKDKRADYLLPLSKQLGLIAKHVASEISGAHLLTRNSDLHAALNQVNLTLQQALMIEMAFRTPLIDFGTVPSTRPVLAAMNTIQGSLGAVRRLAGDLLIAGWEE